MKALILAGGSGSRLWPLSRTQYPKQFLPLSGRHSLIQETAVRVADYPVFVVTAKDTGFLVNHHLNQVIPGFKENRIFGEPCPRNTAPAIAWAASFFNDEEVLAILPSDQTITRPEVFQGLLKQAEALAREGYLITFGIVPTRPETGYGYIKTAQEKIGAARKVEGFKEKPDLATAETYLKDGNYFWNSGMFVFSVKTLKEELKIHAPEVYQVMLSLTGKTPSAEDYRRFPDISIDYAVMEKTQKLALLEADMGWNDLGGFEALHEHMEKDPEGNAAQGRISLKTLKAKNNLIFSMASDAKTIALLGVENLVVADTDDALLICRREDSQEVKKIFEGLKKQGSEEAQWHKKVFRPWGYYVSVREESGFKIKEIIGSEATILMVSHQIDYLQKYSNRLIGLKNL